MQLDDPCLESSPLQARNYVIACYAVALVQGETIKGFQLRHATLMGYIRRVIQLHTDRHLHNPSSAHINYISLITDAVRKWELVPNRREVIHDAMFHHMLKVATTSPSDDFHCAATDWSLLGRYTGFRKSEWCQDSPHSHARITDPLWGDRPDSVAVIAEDFVLKDADGIVIPITLSTPPSAVRFAELRIRYQKNQDNYQILTYSASTATPSTCPVQAILRILNRGLRLNLPPFHPVAIAARPQDPRGYVYITGGDYTSWLQSIASTVYQLPHKDTTTSKWGTHSIRVTAANLLHRAQFSSEFIKNRLRWRSDTFQMYLRNTIYIAEKHTSALTLDIPPPCPCERRAPEPHEALLAASAA